MEDKFVWKKEYSWVLLLNLMYAIVFFIIMKTYN
ncbi:hypothetical protein AX016_2317 [Cellulophaga sp. RHA19]|nr:hypothetical protein AX016_2317 [Cellulophaga sp. RHA19]